MLDKKTQIKMADGSTKCIQEIDIGEKILTQSNKGCIVTNIYMGHENTMYKLTIEDKTIIMSEDQIILTISGLKRADEIIVDDKFALVGEKMVKMKGFSQINYFDTAYMIIFDDSELFFANDIVICSYI